MRTCSRRTSGGPTRTVGAAALWALALVAALAMAAEAGQPVSLSDDAGGSSKPASATADSLQKAKLKAKATTTSAAAKPAAPKSGGATAAKTTPSPTKVAPAPATASKTTSSVAKVAPTTALRPTPARSTPTVAALPKGAKNAPTVARVAPAPTVARVAPTATTKGGAAPPTVARVAPGAKNGVATPSVAALPPGSKTAAKTSAPVKVIPAAIAASTPTITHGAPNHGPGGPTLATHGGTTVEAPTKGGKTATRVVGGVAKSSSGAATQSSVSKAGAAVATAVPLEDHVTYQYNALGRRDPFQSLMDGEYVSEGESGPPPPDLGGLKLMGVVWGTTDQFAMVEDARGNSYVLRRGDRVMNGFVEGLKRDAMIVNITVDGQSQSVSIPITRKGEKSNANR